MTHTPDYKIPTDQAVHFERGLIDAAECYKYESPEKCTTAEKCAGEPLAYLVGWACAADILEGTSPARRVRAWREGVTQRHGHGPDRDAEEALLRNALLGTWLTSEPCVAGLFK